MGATIDTTRAAMALLERERVMTLVTVAGSGRRALVAEIAGGPVRGSWWGHPKGKLIYRIAEELEASGAVLVCKLVAGKVSFVHRAVWPALLRVVLDAAWRQGAARGLSAAASTLLSEVEARGRVSFAGKADVDARKALEASHLVLGTSEHTERGSHAAVLQSWSAWAQVAGASAARGSCADAVAELAGLGIVLDGVAAKPRR